MKTLRLSALMTFCLCMVAFNSKTIAQNYDATAVAMINELIQNNGLDVFGYSIDDPEQWDFAEWNDNDPKLLIKLDFYSANVFTTYPDEDALFGEVSFAGLTSLKYLNCYYNKLTKLDVSGCTGLKNLDCSYNYYTLKQLNLSGCINLDSLHCGDNGEIEELDLTGLNKLTYLNCRETQIAELDLTGFDMLEYLNVNHCYKLTQLDVSGMENLVELWCSYTNKPELGAIGCTNLNVSGCTNLKELYCEDNSLAQLNVKECINLNQIQASRNELTQLDVSECIGLESLWCDNNKLGKLDLSGLVNLFGVRCEENNLTQLDVSGCTNLIDLVCSDNNLAAVDLTGLDALEYVDLSNQSVSLNLYKEEGDDVYTRQIELNNPEFDADEISYSEGLLTSTNKNVEESDFEVETGLAGFTLSGTMYFTYSEAPLEAPVITTDELEGGMIGEEYYAELEATSSEQVIWSIEEGDLPTELTLSEDGVISGIPTEGGEFTFKVKATNAAGSNMKELTIHVGEIIPGLLTVEASKVSVYPNPTSGQLTITNYELGITNVAIYDIMGRNVQSSAIGTGGIDISNLQSGIYYLKIGGETVKVIKN